MTLNFHLVNQIIAALIVLLNFLMIIWIYFASPREKTNKLFVLMAFFITLWIGFGYLADFPNQNGWGALFLNRLSFGFVVLFLVSAYFFSVHFPQKIGKNIVMDKTILISGTLLFPIAIFTNLIAKKLILESWGSSIIFGSGKNFFYLFVLITTILFFFNIFKKYHSLPKKDRVKTQYFLIGLSLFAIFNLVFNVLFPIVRKTVEYYQFGNYSTIFLLGFTALAITKKQLFDVKTLLTDLLVVAMAIVLFIIPFFTNNLEIKIFLSLFFLFFCWFGFLLIRYTHREVKQKEILEQKVQERTKDLQNTYDQLKKKTS
ncbi:MAG: histidine kinase N-terminal 7TM domain-containing protein [Candidatus Pacebacteria bacterium]|nr:histidine kinase N-terminal 7TM domain-containing protein [Candidatus Paceibacterota bacterium]